MAAVDTVKGTAGILVDVPFTILDSGAKGLNLGGEAVCRVSKIPGAAVGKVASGLKNVKNELMSGGLFD
jgi:hypothetical protein